MITKDGRIKGPLLTALIGQAINKSAVEAQPEPLNDGLSLPPVKKNCFNCTHLEYDTDYGEDGKGLKQEWYNCLKREDEIGNLSSKLEDNLNRKEYLEKGKRCFEPKQR